MKIITTLSVWMLLIVNIASSQPSASLPITFNRSPNTETIHLADAAVQLKSNDIISVSQDNRTIQLGYSPKEEFNKQKVTSILHSGLYKKKGILNPGMITGAGIMIGGVVFILIGEDLEYSENGLHSELYGIGMEIAGGTMVVAGGITLIVSTIVKLVKSNSSYSKRFTLETNGNAAALVYHF